VIDLHIGGWQNYFRWLGINNDFVNKFSAVESYSSKAPSFWESWTNELFLTLNNPAFLFLSYIQALQKTGDFCIWLTVYSWKKFSATPWNVPFLFFQVCKDYIKAQIYTSQTFLLHFHSFKSPKQDTRRQLPNWILSEMSLS